MPRGAFDVADGGQMEVVLIDKFIVPEEFQSCVDVNPGHFV
jgi:hypothetical protein